MEVLVLDKDFKNVGVIDDFESLIWTDRYSEAGEFEISTYPNANVCSIAQNGYYLHLKESEHVMIIESLNITTDVEKGNRLIIGGRSLESILDRRIVWGMAEVTGNVEECIRALISSNIIDAQNSRKISNFIFSESHDSSITSKMMAAQYTGDNIYDVIKAICDEIDIGFKVVLADENNFSFSLYNGIDRSYNQSVRPYVIYSPSYENIINSSYLESTKDWKNAALIAGEDRAEQRKVTNIGTTTGLERREIFVDARDIQSEREDQTSYTDEEYLNLLKRRGLEQLVEHTKIKAFEGDVETINSYKYGTDFFLGDIIQIQNEYGYGSAMRVSEVVFSQDSNGINILPTFRKLIGDE